MRSKFLGTVAAGFLFSGNPSLRVNQARGSQQQMTEQSVEARQHLNDDVRACRDGHIADAIKDL